MLPCFEKHWLVLFDDIAETSVTKVCRENNRNFIGIELNPEYIKIAKERMKHFFERG